MKFHVDRLADPFAPSRDIPLEPVANGLPPRPCIPNRPYAYTGPDIQWSNTWTAIKASATYRLDS